MAHTSPLNPAHQQAEASFLVYGPAGDGAEVVETYGELESEYAAIRKGCILLDLPLRATLRITGEDRIEFLNRMVTAELRDLPHHHARSALWCNRKGRIDADLRLIQLPDHMLVDLDILSARRAHESLHEFIFAEDVHIADITDQFHTLALHGPTAARLLAIASEPLDAPPIADLSEHQATRLRIAGHDIVIQRDDLTAEPGYFLHMPVEAVEGVYHTLIEHARQHDDRAAPDAQRVRLRPAGWHAFNIARIEAGTPLYNLDFGPESIPNETGELLNRRVSFTKGCYLGQEVVARLHSLGKPKQTIVALKIDTTNTSAIDAQPLAGAPVYLPDDTTKPIGAVTSSTRAPMLSDAIAILATIRTQHITPGATLLIDTPAGHTPAAIQPQLRFYPRS